MTLKRNIKFFWKRNDFLIICVSIVFSLTVYHKLNSINFWSLPRHVPCDSRPYMNDLNRFSGIVDHQANVTGVVHLLRFGKDSLCFTQGHLDSMISILENYEPKKIYIHTDNVDSIKNIIHRMFKKDDIRLMIDVKFYPRPKHVFGMNFSEKFRNKHVVDFTKLKILRRHGGIFLGNSIHVVQNVRRFLQYEMTVVVRSTMNVDAPLQLFDDVVIAHKDARFLNLWLKSYHTYDERNENHTQGEVMRNLLKKHSMYLHILENDLSKSVILNSVEYKAMLSSRKRFFVNIKNDDNRCL